MKCKSWVYYEWHTWFAWRPVITIEGGVVWLVKARRRIFPYYDWDSGTSPGRKEYSWKGDMCGEM